MACLFQDLVIFTLDYIQYFIVKNGHVLSVGHLSLTADPKENRYTAHQSKKCLNEECTPGLDWYYVLPVILIKTFEVCHNICLHSKGLM